jgi:hypothetical protein
VHVVNTLNLGVVWCGACSVHKVLVCDTKFVLSRDWCITEKYAY